MHSFSVLLPIKLLILFHVDRAHPKKVLFFITWSSHSHRVAMEPLANSLARRGHSVTFFSPLKPIQPHPKIQEFCPSELLALNEMMVEQSSSATTLGRLNDPYFDILQEGTILWDTCFMILEATARSPEFQEWMKRSEFDLIITDQPCKEIAYGMAHIFGAKIVAMTPAAIPLESDIEIFGTPSSDAAWLQGWSLDSQWWYVPNRFLQIYNRLSWYWTFRDYYLPKVDALLQDVFQHEFPPVEEMMQKVDLVLLNEHFSTSYARALPPFHIPVAGMHIQDSNGTLPKKLEDFVADTGKEGFIYISFGSALPVSKLPEDFQGLLFNSIGSFSRTKFLWKWDGDVPASLPKNVLALPWFPQQDVLAHPKCKGFVTQGGQMSVQQSIYHRVPMLVVPGFGDQTFNARAVAHQGVGIYLELSEITKETLDVALRQLLSNEKLASQVKEVSRRFRDKPMPPVDTATWWVEYVLRHDTAHLRYAYVTLPWWQKRQLDFWGILFAFAVLAMCISTKILLCQN